MRLQLLVLVPTRSAFQISPPVYSLWGKGPSEETLSLSLETTLARGREHLAFPQGVWCVCQETKPLQGTGTKLQSPGHVFVSGSVPGTL